MVTRQQVALVTTLKSIRCDIPIFPFVFSAPINHPVFQTHLLYPTSETVLSMFKRMPLVWVFDSKRTIVHQLRFHPKSGGSDVRPHLDVNVSPVSHCSVLRWTVFFVRFDHSPQPSWSKKIGRCAKKYYQAARYCHGCCLKPSNVISGIVMFYEFYILKGTEHALRLQSCLAIIQYDRCRVINTRRIVVV